jgi:hypothetical protein
MTLMALGIDSSEGRSMKQVPKLFWRVDWTLVSVHSFPRVVLWRWPQWYSAVRYVAILPWWVHELYCLTTYDSLSHSKYHCTRAHIQFSLYSWIFNSHLNSQFLYYLRTQELIAVLILAALNPLTYNLGAAPTENSACNISSIVAWCYCIHAYSVTPWQWLYASHLVSWQFLCCCMMSLRTCLLSHSMAMNDISYPDNSSIIACRHYLATAVSLAPQFLIWAHM